MDEEEHFEKRFRFDRLKFLSDEKLSILKLLESTYVAGTQKKN